MIRLSLEGDQLVLNVDVGDLAPRHESQLVYWGFDSEAEGTRFVATTANASELAGKVSSYLERRNCVYELESSINTLLENVRIAQETASLSLDKGRRIKEGNLDVGEANDFLSFLNQHVPRKLKDHQYKAALHLLGVGNGANFSVPGSGKTTVVLSVFQRLREMDLIDALFVVGPPACFWPWRDEYKQTLGVAPTYEILAGGDVDQRRSKYYANIESVCDLYLTTFQTLHRDWEQVRTLFEQQGVRFFLVIDEAHYIKQLDGAWATAALEVARYAERRCILTGTPFPNSYTDAFNLFDALWPEFPPISAKDKQKISFLSKRKDFGQASELLRESVGPFFYRVRKADLGLAPQVFNDPTRIQMNKYERRVYDLVLDKIQVASQSDYFRDLNLLLRLRRGRMMRLRQCLSYTHLLGSGLDDYGENLYEDDQSLAKIIHNYDELESPGKLEALITLISELRRDGEKVVIWSNFVKTLELIHKTVSELGYGAHLIYGATPLQKSTDTSDEFTREKYIRDFVSRQSGIDILIANPAACAESISLHKTCSHAVYYDVSYNCAQYLQSLDRIHRVGGSEDKTSYYHFLQYDDTLDQDILENVRGKAERMSHVIDQDYPIYSLDMFGEEDELAAYDRLFGQSPQHV